MRRKNQSTICVNRGQKHVRHHSGIGTGALAEGKHGLAMYGEPALPPDFVSLPYANPDAPKGGTVVFGETGSFDSLNPHIRKGRVPYSAFH